MGKPLAIVIPAYKGSYLRETLDSIASQSCKDFTLYIGDDNSPYDIASLVSEYSEKIDIVYHRFDSNLGSTDLVSQWERCIDLTSDEQYIWLFSDDDMMGEGCVESFFSLPKDIRENYLIHFNLEVQDDVAGKSFRSPDYRMIMSDLEYLDAKNRGSIYSYVVEFVFSRSLFMKSGRFENYDLAWGSDFITWLKIASNCEGIYTVQDKDAVVSWRKSGENISPDRSHDIIVRKLKSLISNSAYIQSFLEAKGKRRNFFCHSKFVWGEINRCSSVLSVRDVLELYRSFCSDVGFRVYSSCALIMVLILRLFK